jgi:hypothetical protein
MSEQSIRAALAVPPGPVSLAGYDSSARPLAPTGHNRALRNDVEGMLTRQARFWAESTAGSNRSILLVMQGIDTAGKGGVAKHVFSSIGPIGVQYTGFKAPTKEELSHDFLWRIRKQLPKPGVIGIFDRSHYEDVLVVRVHELVPESEWEPRYDAINDFEAKLVAAGTTSTPSANVCWPVSTSPTNTGSSTRAISANAPGGPITRWRSRPCSSAATPAMHLGTSCRATTRSTATGPSASCWTRSWPSSTRITRGRPSTCPRSRPGSPHRTEAARAQRTSNATG